MPHQRKRYLQAALRSLLAYSPVIGVLGHRQVGKTTLIEQEAGRYVTFDKTSSLSRADLDPEAFITSGASHPPFVIDEAQLCPSIFSAIKEHVRINGKPGQFILSGSVRFTSRKAIRESLTGRIINLELFPFSHSEASQRPVQPLPYQLLKADFHQLKFPCPTQDLKRETLALLRYGELGGLPRVCLTREAHHRSQLIETQLETILDRDLKLLLATKLSYQTLRSVLAFLAKTQGEPLNLAETARKTRISLPTLRGLLNIFEQIFLIRRIISLGDEKRPVIFLEDQGEASHLTPEGYDPHSNWLRILYANLRIPYALKPELQCTFFQYRTRGGAYVPLAVRSGKSIIGFLISLEANPQRSILMSAASFGKRFPGARVAILHPYERRNILSPSLIEMPFADLLY